MTTHANGMSALQLQEKLGRNLQNADNSAASIEAFVNANVKRGATLLTDNHKSYTGLTGYRHDTHIVGKMPRTLCCRGFIELFR